MFELRCQGYVWQEIAEAIGYAGKSGAYNAYWRYLDKMAADPKAQKLRQVQRGRLQTLLYAVLLRAVKGDLDCLDRALRIIQEISKLMGLYKPQEVKGTIAIEHIADPLEGLNIGELASLVRLADVFTPENLTFLEGVSNGLSNDTP